MTDTQLIDRLQMAIRRVELARKDAAKTRQMVRVAEQALRQAIDAAMQQSRESVAS